MTTQPREITLIELLFFLGMLALIVWLSGYLVQWTGWSSWIICPLVAMIVVGSWLATSQRLGAYLERTFFPCCENGRCAHFEDYRFMERRAAEGTVWECRCGLRYLIHRSTCKTLGKDGAARPYQRKRCCRGWVNEIDSGGVQRTGRRGI
jgi:hypothetical protein